MDKNEIVYVCYVLDGMGLLKGEEVVPCLTVTQSQSMVDKWLDEQLEEAKENGYLPDEDPEVYKDTCNFSINVSRGNEEEGYDSYFIVCRTDVIE